MAWPDDCAEATFLGLRPEHFRSQKRALVWEAISKLFARGAPTDVVSVVHHLREHGLLADVGGALVVQDMASQATIPRTVPHHFEIVAGAALRRRLTWAATEIIERAEKIPPIELADTAAELVYRASLNGLKAPSMKLSEALPKAIARLEGGPLDGTSTGLKRLDAILGGLLPGQLIIVGARTGLGKSALVTQMARHVSQTAPVLLISLEMSHYEICFRLLCAEARLPWLRVRSHQLTRDEWVRLVEAEARLEPLPLHILDQGGRTVADVRARARRLAREGLGLVVIDYVQLMHDPGRESRQYEVAAISSGLKMLARELEVPIVLVAQLNRGAEEHERPVLSDLRDSGQLEQDADVVLLISKPPKEEGNRINVTVAKQRNGPTGVAKLRFRSEWTAFEEPEIIT